MDGLIVTTVLLPLGAEQSRTDAGNTTRRCESVVPEWRCRSKVCVVEESTIATFLRGVALGMAGRCANNSGYLPKWAGSMVPKLRGKATC